MAEAPFSFRELQEAGKLDSAPVGSLTADDGVILSYRSYVPASPRMIVLFYHGGGAHSGAGYQHLGSGLRQHFNAVVYTPDLRGHGASEGPRGDAPTPRQVWADMTTFIRHLRALHPGLPLFLGGHSSGAGLTLNYTGQPVRESVSGYVFLAPEFGFRSNTGRTSPAGSFVTVDVPAFVANAVSGGKLHGHTHAVRFNYPAEVLESDAGMVGSNTVNMALALTPSAPREQFAALDRPFGLWIGENDELLSPEKVLAFAYLAGPVREGSQAGAIPGGKHLSVLLKAHETIGPWLVRRADEAAA